MAYNNSSPTSGFAKNILMFADTLKYEEPIIFPQHQPKSTHVSTAHNNNTVESFIRVRPNPAKNFIVIEYSYMNTDNMGIIQITDGAGRLIKEFQVASLKDQIIFETSGLSSGMYFCNLYSGNKKIESQKFNIAN
ncbi:MAG: T9SS type A sorting domain-containing protein [Bacteroidota bacterium]